MNKKITFVSHQLYNNENKPIAPKPGKTQVPKWFASANKYWKEDGKEEVLRHQWGAEILGFKSCPALLDMFLNGYYLTTPCDIMFYKDPQSNTLVAKTEPGYERFIGSRGPMNGFAVPYGYEEHHFHWYPNWGVRLEKGYSAIFISPINRYDLFYNNISFLSFCERTLVLVPYSYGQQSFQYHNIVFVFLVNLNQFLHIELKY